MKCSKAVILWIVALYALAMLPPGSSEEPFVVTDDGFNTIELFLLGDLSLNTTPELSLEGADAGEGVEFTIELQGDMVLKAWPLTSSLSGLNLTLSQARSSSPSYPPAVESLSVELYDDDVLIAHGSEDISTLQEYSIHMPFETSIGADRLFQNGSTLKLELEGEVLLPSGNPDGFGSLEMRAKSISDVEHGTRNSRGVLANEFPVNDWPETEVNVSGSIVDAFGFSDIASVDVEIRDDTSSVSSGTASLIGNEFWYVWDYNTLPEGDYAYNATISDVQNNEYYVDGAFSIVASGIALTSPSQVNEGMGFAGGKITSNMNGVYTVNVRNLGDSTATVQLSLSGANSNKAVLEGQNLSGSDQVVDIPAGGYETVFVNVSGAGEQPGEVLEFSLVGVSGALSTSLDFQVEIVPLLGVSLTPEDSSIYIYPGEEAIYDVTIKNLSPEQGDTFDVSFSFTETPGWAVETPNDTEYVLGKEGSGSESKTFQVNITAPTSLSEVQVSFSVIIYATSQTDAQISTSTTLTAVGTKGVSFVDPGVQQVDPGESNTIEIKINNEHDATAQFVFTISSPSSWDDEAPELSKTLAYISGLGQTTLGISIEPSYETPAGAYTSVSYTHLTLPTN